MKMNRIGKEGKNKKYVVVIKINSRNCGMLALKELIKQTIGELR